MERRNIFRAIRDFLFSKANREFLFFLFFLVLSGVFWLMLTLNETYEKELKVPIHIANVPKNVVLTSDEYDTLRVTVKDKGYVLMSYLTQGIKPLNVSFKTYANGTSSGTIPTSDLQKLAAQRVSASSQLISVKPDKFKFYFNYGDKKRVPVKWSGRVIPEQLFYISDVDYSPDSITIYAPKEKLDSIQVVYTEKLNYANFRDTLQIDCRLEKMEGVKMSPERMKVTFYTDILTEESMEGIPIKGINLPKGKELRTFPAKVTVKFVTGVSTYKSLRPSDFLVVADYNEIKNSPADKCNIYLRKVPQGISRVSMELKQVDYLIEEQPTEP